MRVITTRYICKMGWEYYYLKRDIAKRTKLYTPMKNEENGIGFLKLFL
jgi:hypothetical protein